MPCSVSAIEFIGAGVDEEPPFLVMELMINGHVLDFLNAKPTANRVTLVICAALMNVMEVMELSFFTMSRSTKPHSVLRTYMHAGLYMEI